ncbi:hypothetical protein ACU4GD_08965 [Cupriavidus basilensis]
MIEAQERASTRARRCTSSRWIEAATCAELRPPTMRRAAQRRPSSSMHGYGACRPRSEAAARLAREVGFTQVSTSHETSPLMRFVSRGDTTVVDAYLSPMLRRYVDQVAGEMPGACGC